MKKIYTKPYLAVESFQLNAAIAASCSSDGGIAIHYGESTCSDSATGYFADVGVCSFDGNGKGGDGNDGPCYHGPFHTDGQTFISS